MEWSKLISTKRLGQEVRHSLNHDDRTEFKRDYDRLIFSAPFRRLQNKTQVFPLPGSVFVHNRLTHSLEVACVGMSLGNDVAKEITLKRPELRDTRFQEIGQIVAAACLAHDMGNPPFGHSGERAIQTFFSEGEGLQLKSQVSDEFWSDITHFEGNANAFRLLTHRFKGRRAGGFVMTYSTLASIVKYPFESRLAGEKGKFGFFASEKDDYIRIAEELGIEKKPVSDEEYIKAHRFNGFNGFSSLQESETLSEVLNKKNLLNPLNPCEKSTPLLRYSRHPLVYLVEAADDICYEIMDIEDAHKLKLLSYEQTCELLLGFYYDDEKERLKQRIEEYGVTDDNEKVVYLRACVIGKLENECVKAFVEHEEEILAGTFQGSLIKAISPTLRDAYAHCAKVSKREIYRSKPVLDVELAGYKIMETLMRQMVEAAMHPDRYYSQQLIGRVSSQYDIDSPDLETRLMAVIDYISGMTDVYALDIYQKINGISLPLV